MWVPWILLDGVFDVVKTLMVSTSGQWEWFQHSRTAEGSGSRRGGYRDTQKDHPHPPTLKRHQVQLRGTVIRDSCGNCGVCIPLPSQCTAAAARLTARGTDSIAHVRLDWCPHCHTLSWQPLCLRCTIKPSWTTWSCQSQVLCACHECICCIVPGWLYSSAGPCPDVACSANTVRGAQVCHQDISEVRKLKLY